MKNNQGNSQSVCDGCRKKKHFSFQCMRGCQKFKDHLKTIAGLNGSPCKDFRCGVPAAENRELCGACPIRSAYVDGIDNSKSVRRVFKYNQKPAPRHAVVTL
ncbi:MAG: hypothetical protein RBS77_01780 [Candidatus Moranbacteria bacterium]|jgi:hypothetical protein|nr:hypothetical protein [Candidatus Moranbacteria bacterium]